MMMMMKHQTSLTLLGGLCILAVACLADKPSPQYKGSSNKEVAQKRTPSATASAPTSQPVAEARQDFYGSSPQSSAAVDSYGSPQSAAIENYGSPQAPVVDNYGSPQSPALEKSSSAGQVGTQGYYYYYYPVASTYNSGSAGPSGGGGGGGSGYGGSASQKQGTSGNNSVGGFGSSSLPIIFIVGSIIIGIIIAIVMSANVLAGREFPSLGGAFDVSSFDLDDLAMKVYQGIQAYNDMK